MAKKEKNSKQSKKSMKSVSWATKYRPFKFSDIAGHAKQVESIKSSIESGELPRAILITGGTGTGKTTLARIIGASINCERDDVEPCGECGSCTSMLNDKHPDFEEYNVSERRNIDDVRSMLKQIAFRPRTSIRIMFLDEIHRINTPHASNALLKGLEEPPQHAMWILGTTNPEQLIDTIKGRCRTLHLHPVSKDDIAKRLKFIAKEEGFDKVLTKANLLDIAESSGGHVRNAVQTLEDVCSVIKGKKKPKADWVASTIREVAYKVDAPGNVQLATYALMSVYTGNIRMVNKTVARSEDAVGLANQLGYMNQYMIDKVTGAEGSNVWHTATFRSFYKTVTKKIGGEPKLGTLITVQAALIEAKESIMTFSSVERSVLATKLMQVAAQVRTKSK